MTEEQRARRDEIDRRVNDRYLIHPGQQDAFRNDPQFHLHVKMIRDLVQAVDESMTAEEVSVEVRDRVCCRLLYGEAPEGISPPDFREAHNRMADRMAAILQAMNEPLGGPKWERS